MSHKRKTTILSSCAQPILVPQEPAMKTQLSEVLPYAFVYLPLESSMYYLLECKYARP
ncbi:MAG: hypothetical protein ACOYOA_11685 [Saprospiraceae bacterium]